MGIDPYLSRVRAFRKDTRKDTAISMHYGRLWYIEQNTFWIVGFDSKERYQDCRHHLETTREQQAANDKTEYAYAWKRWHLAPMQEKEITEFLDQKGVTDKKDRERIATPCVLCYDPEDLTNFIQRLHTAWEKWMQ